MRRTILAGVAAACVAIGSGPAAAQAPTATPAQVQTTDRLAGSWRIEQIGRTPDQFAFAQVTVAPNPQGTGFSMRGGSFTSKSNHPNGFTTNGAVSPTGEITYTPLWSPKSTLRLMPDGSISGEWQLGSQKGREVWTRQQFFAERAHVSIDTVPSPTTVPASLGSSPLRIEVDASRFRTIILDVHSLNAWGEYPATLEPAGGVRIQGTSQLCTDGADRQYGGWPYCYSAPGQTIAAIRYRISVGPQSEPGRRVLTIDNYKLPFDLVLTNRVTAQLRFVEDGTTTELKELPFYRKFRIEAAYPKPPSGTTREVTLTWDGNSTPRKIILRLMDGGIFRSEPLTVEPPR
jgi:hypothetical protein